MTPLEQYQSLLPKGIGSLDEAKGFALCCQGSYDRLKCLAEMIKGLDNALGDGIDGELFAIMDELNDVVELESVAND